MPTLSRIARQIETLIAADPANADRIRDMLPPATSAPVPAAAPRKKAAVDVPPVKGQKGTNAVVPSPTGTPAAPPPPSGGSKA